MTIQEIINSKEAIKRIKAATKVDFYFRIDVDTFGLPNCYNKKGECGWSCNEFGFKVGQALNKKAKELKARHQRFVNYMRESRHNWQDGQITHYADNSIEVTQTSQLTGETRQIMTKAPSGDACF